MPDPQWELAYVLPNLTLPDPSPDDRGDGSDGNWSDGLALGQDTIAVVPALDLRLTAIRDAVPGAAKLLDGFRTVGDHPHHPAALIIRVDAPAAIRTDLEAIISFRNAIAFSFILRARAAGVGKEAHVEPTWSDTFDFHPTVIGRQGHLVTEATALRAIFSSSASFIATPSPYMHPCGRKLYADQYLFRAFGRLWSWRYERGRRASTYSRALFRSLEVAFAAASAAMKNQGSLSDYGAQMALWVSAIEILAWPEDRRADLSKVHRLLGRYGWMSEVLNERRFRLTWRKHRIRCNAVQRVYAFMYKARNRFLHGESVTPRTLVPSRGNRIIPLPALAAIVYRTALAAYLAKRIPPVRVAANRIPPEYFDQITYSGALKRGLNLGKEVADPDGD